MNPRPQKKTGHAKTGATHSFSNPIKTPYYNTATRTGSDQSLSFEPLPIDLMRISISAACGRPWSLKVLPLWCHEPLHLAVWSSEHWMKWRRTAFGKKITPTSQQCFPASPRCSGYSMHCFITSPRCWGYLRNCSPTSTNCCRYWLQEAAAFPRIPSVIPSIPGVFVPITPGFAANTCNNAVNTCNNSAMLGRYLLNTCSYSVKPSVIPQIPSVIP